MHGCFREDETMKIGFYDMDAAGGMIPMIIKLEEENIPFKQIYFDKLKSVKKLDLLIINYLGLPHFPREFLKKHCMNMKKVVESNPNTKFLMMIPGQDWWPITMNKELGIHKNVNYVTDTSVSKLAELLEEIR